MGTQTGPATPAAFWPATSPRRKSWGFQHCALWTVTVSDWRVTGECLEVSCQLSAIWFYHGLFENEVPKHPMRTIMLNHHLRTKVHTKIAITRGYPFSEWSIDPCESLSERFGHVWNTIFDLVSSGIASCKILVNWAPRALLPWQRPWFSLGSVPSY